MKPHEETWVVSPDATVRDEEGTAVAEDALRRSRLALIAAAPEMARAILALICDDPGCRRDACIAGRAALTTAGVPLP